MSNSIINFDPSKTQVASAFAGEKFNDELSGGIIGGMAVVGYKGKVWTIKHKGNAHQQMRPDGDGPRHSIEVIIIRSSTHLAKTFYEKGWVDGTSERPDCWSSNGMTPDASVAVPPCRTCVTCPHNQFGSRITENGGRGKRCSDVKRLAIVPADDIDNEVFGGPMLLRTPAASLKDLDMYAKALSKMGVPYCAVVTKIAFEAEQSFPKFVFTGVRQITEAEADKIKELRDDPRTLQILAESEVNLGDIDQVVDPSVAAIAASLKAQASAPQAPVTQAPKLAPPAKAVPKVAPATALEAACDAIEVRPPAPKLATTAAKKPLPTLELKAEPEAPEASDAVTDRFGDDLDAAINNLLG